MELEWVLWGVFLIIMLPAAISDYRYLKIPDLLIWVCLIIQVCLIFIMNSSYIITYGITWFVGYGSFLLIKLITHNNIGNGDVKFAGVLCATLGVVMFSLSILASIVLTLFILIISKESNIYNKSIPFITYMYAGNVFIKLIFLIVYSILVNT